jgi:hypothetical protein
MKFLFRIFLFLFFSILLTSCATVSLSNQDKANLKKINLSHQVTIPKDMLYVAHGEQYAMAAPGVIEILAANSVAGGDVGEIKNIMAKNNINLEELLIKQTSEALSKSGITIDENSNTVMYLSVVKYGFIAADAGFSLTNMNPVLKIDGKIVKNGKIIWQNSSNLGVSDLPSYSLKDIKNNPEILRRSLTQAAKTVAEKLVAELND